MTNTIILRRMGCPFHKNDIMNHLSDVGNHRVRAEFTDKEGHLVIVDFMHKLNSSQLWTDGQYATQDAPSLLFRAHPQIGYRTRWGERYNLADILKVINEVSAEHYDEIKLEGMEE